MDAGSYGLERLGALLDDGNFGDHGGLRRREESRSVYALLNRFRRVKQKIGKPMEPGEAQGHPRSGDASELNPPPQIFKPSQSIRNVVLMYIM